MKLTLYIVISLLFFSTNIFSQSGQKNFIDQPYIEVTGQVETKITPNEIYLNIVLNENDKKGRISIEKQENQMLTKLRALNLNLDKNLSVLDFDGFYKKKFLGDNEVTKKKTYQLIVNDGKTLGEVYRTLDDIDISNISIQKVSHTEIEKLKRVNKIKALKIAKEKAIGYASAIDQKIGNALFIQEIINNSSAYRNTSNVVIRGYTSGYSKNDKIENLQINKITLKSTILARFTLN